MGAPSAATSMSGPSAGTSISGPSCATPTSNGAGKPDLRASSETAPTPMLASPYHDRSRSSVVQPGSDIPMQQSAVTPSGSVTPSAPPPPAGAPLGYSNGIQTASPSGSTGSAVSGPLSASVSASSGSALPSVSNLPPPPFTLGYTHTPTSNYASPAQDSGSTNSPLGSQRLRSKPLPLPQQHDKRLQTSSDFTPNADTPSLETLQPKRTEEKNRTSSLVPISVGPHTFHINAYDTISTFANASFSFSVEGPHWQQQGVLSYAGLLKSDPFVKILRSFAMLLFKSGELAAYLRNETLKRTKLRASSTPGSTSTSSPPSKRQHTALAAMSPLSVDLILSKEKEVDDEPGDLMEEDTLLIEQIKVKETGEKTRRKPKYQIPHMIQLPGSKDDYFKLLESSILPILPNKLNMFMLFCRYFKYVHPFISIINENSLVLDLNRILDGFPSFERTSYTALKLENDSDVNTLGIMLLVVRLGYMSLIHNEDLYNQHNEDEKNIMMDVKRVSSETFVRAIKLCIDDRVLAQKLSFKLVQLLCLSYFYKQLAPDDLHGLSGTDAQILFGVAITHAKLIGLNRDPKMFTEHENISRRESLPQVWRSLWFYLSTTDAMYAIHCGMPPFWQSMDVVDTKLPHKEDLTGEFNDVVHKIDAVCNVYRELAFKISNVNERPRVVEVLEQTNKLEAMFTDLFGKDFFKDCIQKPVPEPTSLAGFDVRSREHEELVVKVIKYVAFINLRTNLNCMYYMIAIHYENEYGQCDTELMNAGIELFKIFCKSVLQLVFLMSYVLDNLVEVFGKNFDFYVTAHTERSMVKMHNLLTSLFVRLLHHKKELTVKSQTDSSVLLRLEIVDVLFSIVVVEADVFVGYLHKLLTNYINLYRIYVMTYFILKQCMDDPQVLFDRVNDKKYLHEGTCMVEFFSHKELLFLCKMCEDFRTAKDDQARVRKNKLKAKAADAASENPSPYNLPFPDSYSQLQLNPIKNEDIGVLSESPWNASDGSPMGVFDGGEDLMKLFLMYSGMDS